MIELAHIYTFHLSKTIGSKVQFVVEWEKKRDEDDELNGSKHRKTVSSGSDLFSVDKEITVLSFLLLLIQWRARIIE